jgi:hypothetical protein
MHSTPITGNELLKLVAEIRSHQPELTQEKIATLAGYQRINSSGEQVGDPLALLDALIQATIGKELLPKPGAKPKFELMIQSDGKLILGPAHMRIAGLRLGMRIKVTILERGKILLQPKGNYK